MKSKTFEIVIFAILIESIITYINQFFVQEIFSWQMFLSIISGIVVAVAYKIDLPSYFNLKSDVKYIGSILTGILLARGSNYIYDILEKVIAIKWKIPRIKTRRKNIILNVLTFKIVNHIIKVVGVKPFEKRSASKEITKY